MVSRVLPHQIDNRNLRPAGVVQIRESIAQARAEVKQSACRFLGHAGVAVGSSGDDTFKEAEDATHFRNLVKRGDNVNLRRAGVGEAGSNAACYQRADQTFSAVHRESSLVML
jgi:hypothetical protein